MRSAIPASVTTGGSYFCAAQIQRLKTGQVFQALISAKSFFSFPDPVELELSERDLERRMNIGAFAEALLAAKLLPESKDIVSPRDLWQFARFGMLRIRSGRGRDSTAPA